MSKVSSNKIKSISNLIKVILEDNKLYPIDDIQFSSKLEDLLCEELTQDLKYPPYVSMNGIALRLKDGNRYWRDAGHWEVGCKKKNGKLVSVNIYGRDFNYLGNVELKEITREEWKKDNKGYV